MAGWFDELPPTAKGALVIGGTLVGAFSGKLPDERQTFGLFLGILAASYGVAAIIWHWLSKLSKRVGTYQTIFLLALFGVWLCLTIALGAGAWAT